MRTVIYVLGLMFCELFMKHWGMKEVSESSSDVFLCVFLFAVFLDIFKE